MRWRTNEPLLRCFAVIRLFFAADVAFWVSSGATGATAMNTGTTGNNDIETGPTGLPSEKEVKIQEAKKELEEKSKAHQSLNEDENSNITI